MSLQFILGGSGSGKSTYLYRTISKEAAEHPEQNYIILVPDQFTLETQKTLVDLSENGGILNIDVLSFHRLAYRALEEVPALRKTVLEDTGKMMLLRKVLGQEKKHLMYFKQGLSKPGFLDECKSLLCELMQYGIGEEQMDAMAEAVEDNPLMAMKVRDIAHIYKAFLEKMGDTYMMAEELIPQLTQVVSSISMLQDSVICLDGFTGFTPTQYDLLQELLSCCSKMYVTVTVDRTERRQDVFSMSRDTIERLSKIAAQVPTQIEEPVMTGKGKEKRPYRLVANEPLSFLEENLFAYNNRHYPEELSAISLHVCDKESHEAQYVARKIWWLIHKEGYKEQEIAVVSADIEGYESGLTHEFERLGIDCFVDQRKNMGANAMVEFVLAFLEMYKKNMDAKSVSEFLRTGLTCLSRDEVDLLENYILASGRRGFRSYKQEWKYEVKREELSTVNEYRSRFVAFIEHGFEYMAGGKKTVEEFCRGLYLWLEETNVYQSIREKQQAFEEEGQQILANEYKRIYRMMMEFLNEMVELLGDEIVSFSEFYEMLRSGMEEGVMGFTPPGSNQVVIGDVYRSRLRNIKVLFFIGISEDRIPKGSASPGILSERERKLMEQKGIELAPSTGKQALTEQYYLYLTLTKASERLYLSYSRMANDGGSKSPAYLISQIKKMYPKMHTIHEDVKDTPEQILGTDQGRSYLIEKLMENDYQKDKAWWQIAAYYKEYDPKWLQRLFSVYEEDKSLAVLTEGAVALLYSNTWYGSVTSMETFARCPYSYYIKYGLGLIPREEYQVQSLDFGNVLHNSMEFIFHHMEEQKKTWQQVEKEEIYELSQMAVNHALEGSQGDKFRQSKRTEYYIKRMKRVIQCAAYGMVFQMQQGKFVQTRAELNFSVDNTREAARLLVENNKKILLNGKIDRIDIYEEKGKRQVKIIDYKSGRTDLQLDKMYYGLQLQLLTYMSAALEIEKHVHENQKVVPAAMLYYQIKEPELEWREETEENRINRSVAAMSCTGLVTEDPEVVELLDKNLAGNGEYQESMTSAVLPIQTTKGGTPGKRSSVVTEKEFRLLMEHARKKEKEFASEIFQGNIGAKPYMLKNENGCEYCELHGICGKEMKNISKYARQLEEKTDSQIWGDLYGTDFVE